MKLVFEFARIAAFCFAGEVCHLVLPLPIPASVYGLMLLLAALRFGVVKLEQVRTAALFLTGFFALHRINPHHPPLVRVPVNSFEF